VTPWRFAKFTRRPIFREHMDRLWWVQQLAFQNPLPQLQPSPTRGMREVGPLPHDIRSCTDVFLKSLSMACQSMLYSSMTLLFHSREQVVWDLTTMLTKCFQRSWIRPEDLNWAVFGLNWVELLRVCAPLWTKQFQFVFAGHSYRDQCRLDVAAYRLRQ